MPELPEVETMRRGILPACGSTVVDCGSFRCSYRPIAISPAIRTFRRKVVGQSIDSIDRVGKRVVIWLESRHAIIIEPRMAGLVLVEESPTVEHLRWWLQLSGGPIEVIRYWDRRGLGAVKLIDEKGFRVIFAPERVGPDALQVDSVDLRDRLKGSSREIKVALMDQRVVAGIGNLYASEVLHAAGIHPQQRCCQLSSQQWRRLRPAIQKVLTEAIEYEGSTLNDGTYRNVLNKDGKYQNAHQVYNRQGARCTRCKRGVIQRIRQNQRSTYFCDACQKLIP